MVSIKASINLGLSGELKEAFPAFKLIDPSSCHGGRDATKGLIDIKQGKSINPYWVAGFTEAEGCFFVVIQNNKFKAEYQVKVGYQVSQHLKDLSLIKSLKDFFECGRTEPCGKGRYIISCYEISPLNRKSNTFFWELSSFRI